MSCVSGFNLNYVYAGVSIVTAAACNFGTQRLWSLATAVAKEFGKNCPTGNMFWRDDITLSPLCEELARNYRGYVIVGVPCTIAFSGFVVGVCLCIWNTRPVRQLNTQETAHLFAKPLVTNVPFPVGGTIP